MPSLAITNGLPIPGLGGVPIEILVAGALLAAGLVIGIFARLRVALLAFAAMLFVASTGQATTTAGIPIRQWLNPIQANRSTLFVGLGTLLGIGLLAHLSVVNRRRWPTQAIVILLIAVYAAMMRIVHDGAAEGVISLTFALLTILPLAMLAMALLEDWEDVYGLLRTIAWTLIAWVGAVVIQLLINPALLTKGRQGRFLGLLGNPQHAAVLLGVGAVILLWLLVNDPRRRLRIVWLAALTFTGVLLLWTGSRTGFGMFALGAAVAAYSRLGRTVLLLPAMAVAGIVGVWVAGRLGIDLGVAERLTSTENTRAAAWRNLADRAAESPWIGVGVEAAGDSENSYLFGMAAYGIGMLLLILTLMFVSLQICIRLRRIRPFLGPDQRPVVDLVIAYNLMYFAGAVLEGYLMARVSSQLVMPLVFAAIATRVLELGSAPAAAWTEEDPEAHPPGWSDADDDVAWPVDPWGRPTGPVGTS